MSVSMVTPQRILQAALASAHGVLEATMADVDDELANRPAPGTANPLGSSYAHVAFTEDAIVNGLLQGKPPLWSSACTGRTGTDRPMPLEGMVPGDIGAWYHTVRIDLAACREYAAAVYAQSEAFIAATDEAALAREVQTPTGSMPLAVAVATLVISHSNQLAGEISAIKGAFGLRGYPF
jgi:DinB superfamily